MKTWHAEVPIEAMRKMLHRDFLMDEVKFLGQSGDVFVFSAELGNEALIANVTADMAFTVRLGRPKLKGPKLPLKSSGKGKAGK